MASGETGNCKFTNLDMAKENLQNHCKISSNVAAMVISNYIIVSRHKIGTYLLLR